MYIRNCIPFYVCFVVAIVPIAAHAVEYTYLTSDGGKDPCWTRDGTDRIVYHNGSHVFVVSPDTGESFEITSYMAGWSLRSPSWSPDGAHVAFFTFKNGLGIVACDAHAAGDSSWVALGGDASCDDMQWSPVADEIVFQSNVEGDHALFVSPLVEGGFALRERILGGWNDTLRPSWSPDGQQIAIEYQDYLYVVPADGSAIPQQLPVYIPGWHMLGYPAWSPDGRWIAFVEYWGSSPHTRYTIRAVSPTSGEAVDVTPDTTIVLRAPTWSEDGTRMACQGANGVVLVEDYPLASIGLNETAHSVISNNRCTPNPFNARTEIAFGLKIAGWVMVVIHDLQGRSVATVWQGEMNTGRQAVYWNGEDSQGIPVASGSYIYRIKTGGRQACGRVAFVK